MRNSQSALTSSYSSSGRAGMPRGSGGRRPGRGRACAARSRPAPCVTWPSTPSIRLNSRCSSRVWPTSRSTSRAAPSASACQGVAGRTSPSTTGANGIGRCVIWPQRSRHWSIVAAIGSPTAEQPGWDHRGQVGHRGPHPQLGGAGGGDVGGELRREERPRHALRDRPAEEPGGARHGQQRGDRSTARRLPEDRHPVRVAAERPDVVPHPLQRGDLVEQPPVGRGAVDLRETLDAETVVERHHDGPAPGQLAAVVLREAGRCRSHSRRRGSTPAPAALPPDRVGATRR